jgi:hypothetical protein
MSEARALYNIDQNSAMEVIADEDNVINIRSEDSLTSREMVSVQMYGFFKYDHPHDDDDEKKLKHAAAENFLVKDKDMSTVFIQTFLSVHKRKLCYPFSFHVLVFRRGFQSKLAIHRCIQHNYQNQCDFWL